MAKLTFLGTGTSSGVPVLGCQCDTCLSKDRRDRRLRTSALLELKDSVNILFDCGPDFRQQMLNIDYRKIDAIFITHEHYDHIGGLEDLRPSQEFETCSIYTESACENSIKSRLSYCFSEKKYPGIPSLEFKKIKVHNPINIKGHSFIPFRVFHGELPIVGFRYKKFAYITDMKSIEEDEIKQLYGIEILVVNALRYEKHHSHLSLEEALSFAQKIGVSQTYITHISHQLGTHNSTEKILPQTVSLAYDGLSIVI